MGRIRIDKLGPPAYIQSMWLVGTTMMAAITRKIKIETGKSGIFWTMMMAAIMMKFGLGLTSYALLHTNCVDDWLNDDNNDDDQEVQATHVGSLAYIVS